MQKLIPLLLALALLCTTRAFAQQVTFTNGTITASCPTANASTGTCPAGSYLILNPGNYVGIRTVISGSTAFVATIQLWVSPIGNCTNFQPVSMINKSSNDTLSMSASSAGLYDSNGMNSCNAMLIATSYTSGTVTASITAGPADVAFNASSSGANVTVSNLPEDGSGNLKVSEQTTVTVSPSGGSMTVAGPGSAGAPSGGVLTVQGASGMQALHDICDSGCIGMPGGWSVSPVNGSTCNAPAVCVLKNSAGVFGGITNESTSAQPSGNCVWYDNASAASGTVLYIETNIGAGQIVTMPYPGVAFVNGLTMQCAASLTGSGLITILR